MKILHLCDIVLRGFSDFLEKTRKEGVLFIICHFDSWPTSPGGSDDLASCVILLNLFQFMMTSKQSPSNTIIYSSFTQPKKQWLLISHDFCYLILTPSLMQKFSILGWPFHLTLSITWQIFREAQMAYWELGSCHRRRLCECILFWRW